MDLYVLRTWVQARFARDDRGASMVEYILLVSLIALAVIAAVAFFGGMLGSKFDNAGSQVSSVG